MRRMKEVASGGRFRASGGQGPLPLDPVTVLNCTPHLPLRSAAKRQFEMPLCGGRETDTSCQPKSFGIQGQWPLAAGGPL